MENGNAPAPKKDIEMLEQKVEMVRSEFHHGFDDERIGGPHRCRRG